MNNYNFIQKENNYWVRKAMYRLLPNFIIMNTFNTQMALSLILRYFAYNYEERSLPVTYRSLVRDGSRDLTPQCSRDTVYKMYCFTIIISFWFDSDVLSMPVH